MIRRVVRACPGRLRILIATALVATVTPVVVAPPELVVPPLPAAGCGSRRRPASRSRSRKPDGTPVTSAQDAAKALDYYAGRGVITLVIERQGFLYTTDFIIR